MLVADEMDLPLDHVDIPLSDARPELLFNQLTGGSSSVRSLYHPVRATAALARARLVAAAARQWNVGAEKLITKAGEVVAPDGRAASCGSLSGAAADTQYTFSVNGSPVTIDVPADMPLLWVLRDKLGITGPKCGCGIGVCHACTSHLGGEEIQRSPC